jgi:hypothetical protein
VTLKVILEEKEKKPESFLSFYNERWIHFSYVVGSFGDDLMFLEDTVTHIYNELYKPTKPIFTFMRYLTKVWEEEIFTKLFPLIREEALLILKNFNVSIFNKAATDYKK